MMSHEENAPQHVTSSVDAEKLRTGRANPIGDQIIRLKIGAAFWFDPACV